MMNDGLGVFHEFRRYYNVWADEHSISHELLGGMDHRNVFWLSFASRRSVILHSGVWHPLHNKIFNK